MIYMYLQSYTKRSIEETYMWNNEQAGHIFCHNPSCSISWATSTRCHRNSLIHLHWRKVAPAHSRILVSGRDSHHCWYGELVLRISTKKIEVYEMFSFNAVLRNICAGYQGIVVLRKAEKWLKTSPLNFSKENLSL